MTILILIPWSVRPRASVHVALLCFTLMLADKPPTQPTAQLGICLNVVIRNAIQEEVESLREGEVREREPARSPQQQQGQSQQQRSGRQYGQQAFGQGLRSQVLTVGRWRSLAICGGDVQRIPGLLMAEC